ncbi:Phosphoglycerate transport system sensor protein pgtB [Serratia fonticola]|uniref:histidine kinase n=1 Tax=Serratia fonticola TaxID=47917 RepID=A0A4U9WEZ1_SERFO|nr:Phosphoglycerate transport system sensor protein pgtB [Serratia fonticola]
MRATQDELVQAAKLAVVGQTMTTLAHEINQPLNALSMYLFTARHAVEKQQPEAATLALTKADGLIGRMDAIIRMLRQFTRRTEQDSPSQPVDLRQSLLAALGVAGPSPPTVAGGTAATGRCAKRVR